MFKQTPSSEMASFSILYIQYHLMKANTDMITIFKAVPAMLDVFLISNK